MVATCAVSTFLMILRRPLTKRKDRPMCRFGARQVRIIKTSLAILALLYPFFISVHFPTISRNGDFAQSEIDIVSKSCWSSDSGSSNDFIQNPVAAVQGVRSSKATDVFRILCTSTRKKIRRGSYQLRCRDLKTWAQKCTKNAEVFTDVSFEDIQRLRWMRYALGLLKEEEKLAYNATIFVKSFPEKSRVLPLYGNMFVDMVDEYGYGDDDIPSEMHLILQTDWQGRQVFPTHDYTVVEHWYNSFPADMAREGPPEYIPQISHHSNISIATIWNTKRDEDPTEGGCPKLNITNISYSCLDVPFDISKWYPKLFNERKDICEMEKILANPRLGTGMMYYKAFRKFDALVVLAKNDSMKLKYGNIQRAVSQMRSGVPVLVEIRGRVLEEFVKTYNYSCVFQRHSGDTLKKDSAITISNYMTFHDAVLQLARPEFRKQCQEQGLAIANDFAPSTIARKFLQAVGYSGDFSC